MEVILDSSALTRIYELPSQCRSTVVAQLGELGRVHVTTVNVIEASMHPDATERERKLAFYADLAGDVGPADPPNELLIKTAVAYLDDVDTINLVSDEAWALLRASDLLSKDVRNESFAWTEQRQREFRAMYERLRATYQEHFAAVPSDRPSSPLELIAYFCARLDKYLDIPILAFEHATGVTPSRDQILTFMQSSTPWRLFWAARVHALYSRSVQAQGYGHRNAGQTDLESSIYLAFCDLFVTRDRPQYLAFQDLNTLNHRNSKVVWYGDLWRHFMPSTKRSQ